MKLNKSKSESLSEKINATFRPCEEVDPELDAEDVTAAKFEHLDREEIHVSEKLSDIRKKNIKFLSDYGGKYKGKVTSRSDLGLERNLSCGGSSESENDGTDDDENNEINFGIEELRTNLQNEKLISESEEESGEVDSNNSEESEAEVVDEGEEEKEDSDGTVSEDDEESADEEELDEAEETDQGSETENDLEDDQHADDDPEVKTAVSAILEKRDDSHDVQKGVCVKNQLKLWEDLLEIRIHSQKMSIASNSLPQTQQFQTFCEVNEEFSTVAKSTQKALDELLNKMLEMQEILLKNNPETKSIQKEFRKRSSKTNETDYQPANKYAAILENNFNCYRNYRNTVLLKWHDRTKIMTPGAGSRRNKSLADNYDIVKKIDAALLNKSDLIKKTQIVKGNYTLFDERTGTVVGHSDKNGHTNGVDTIDTAEKTAEPQISCPELYDDTDFYHQQLREIIEYKTNMASTPAEIGRQLVELQKLRHKMKKTVDTRASKGRKIRYVVHNKMVNFMAPNPFSSWTEDSKNELYRSLFCT